MKKNSNVQVYSVDFLREYMRRSSMKQAEILSRSVSRLTSSDEQPCVEYGAEIQAERDMIDRLLYIQQCRSALEHCIDKKQVRMRYKWRDGRITEMWFRRMPGGKVRISAA